LRTWPAALSDGRELSDRWQEALVIKDMIRALWDRITAES